MLRRHTEELPQRMLCCFETTHLRSVRHTTPGGRNQMLVRARWRALHGLSPPKPQPRTPPTPPGCWWPPSPVSSSPLLLFKGHPILANAPFHPQNHGERQNEGYEHWAFSPFSSLGVYLSPLLSHSSNVYYTFTLHLSFMETMFSYNTVVFYRRV